MRVSLAFSSMYLVAICMTNALTKPVSMYTKPVSEERTNADRATQQKSNPNNTESTKTQGQSLSPYEIASFITDNPQADLRQIWARLDIKKAHFGDSSDNDEE